MAKAEIIVVKLVYSAPFHLRALLPNTSIVCHHGISLLCNVGMAPASRKIVLYVQFYCQHFVFVIPSNDAKCGARARARFDATHSVRTSMRAIKKISHKSRVQWANMHGRSCYYGAKKRRDFSIYAPYATPLFNFLFILYGRLNDGCELLFDLPRSGHTQKHNEDPFEMLLFAGITMVRLSASAMTQKHHWPVATHLLAQ